MMNSSNLTAAHLRQAMKLLDQKASLQGQLQDLDQQIARVLSGNAGSGGKATGKAKTNGGAGRGRKGSGGTTAKRGDLKASILAALHAAGEAGASVKDLAAKLGAKGPNLHAFFNSTGKKIEGLKKIGKGHYQLFSGAKG